MSDNPSLKVCPFCAETILAEAIKCRHCGSDLSGSAPAGAAPRKKSPLAWILIGLILFGCFVVWAVGRTMAERSPTSTGPTDFDACVMAHLYVEDRLIAPRSAQHQACSQADVYAVGGNRYRVASYVDADNALGVSVRTRYTAVLRYAGGDWSLETMNLDN